MAVIALPWVRDEMTIDEEETVIQLLNLASRRPLALLDLVDKPWMQDGLSRSELQVIFYIASIAHTDGMSVEQIIRMPFLNSINLEDLIILETLRPLEREDLRWLLSHSALTGGITDDHRATTALLRLQREDPKTSAELMALPWIGDGVGSSEVDSVLELYELALESRKVFRELAPRPWMQDGLSLDERTIVTGLLGISGASFAKRDETAVLRILTMPFLETVEGADAAAVDSLQRLFWESDQVDYLGKVLSHPTLRDGITDDQAMVVAALGIVVRERPQLLDTLLDLGQNVVEKRVVRLPLSGEVTLSVINVSPGDYSTLDILETTVRLQEEFMDIPFPRRYVGLLVADATAAGGSGGPGGLINVDPGYAEDDYIIAHEVAHTYWNFFPSWIAEGAADFMTTVSADKQFSSHECSLGDTLSDLDQLYWELAENGKSTEIIRWSGCAYSLGRGLFLDLYETLGDQSFRRGFGGLYTKMQGLEFYDECAGLEKGLCYIRAALVADAEPDSAALAEPVIHSWYYGPGQSR